jgi:hypothetical protein
MAKCKYCGHKTRKVETNTKDLNGSVDYYIVCNKCKNVLHKPPSHIQKSKNEEYLKKVIDKNDNT